MYFYLSIIICTHNPRQDYLARVLEALKKQSLSLNKWEMLLIDNVSDELLSSEIDLSWHPHSRHIREDELGLTPARLRGIREAKAEILVFVDDDNVLDDDYLEVVLKISKDYPFIGAWGGKIKPEFEVTPPDWTKPYWDFLAIRDFEADRWSNLIHHNYTVPCGAGLCVRRVVAEKYNELLRQDSQRTNLDRKGKLLTSCGDTDLALTACTIGLGTGQFTSLGLTHLIPEHRIQEDYLLQLVKEITCSSTILKAIWGEYPNQSSRSQKLFEFYKRLRMDSRSRRFYDASQQGKKLAMQKIAS
ncbi:glycosyltransferase family 2 protein [Picosynechococcus sp. PCC 11901]|uniref:glycosyltransferase n=1 Tax=Picosynechococcus sp. PCC 11901 TaxID=2579791 RepID=UPI0010FBDD2A|nr:glycosyltransferase [Picosynechococcus sp. PCC 11901]QCS50061.1 glycosyltransferase family 2 protein [Picosynechococcus sp. PCC 11901]